MARRHRCAAAICAALEPVRRRDPCAGALHSMLRRDRWTASLRAQRVRCEAQEIVSALEAFGITPVLLKGAHRALCGIPEAQLYDSQDIDVLVERHELERARDALEAAGYRQRGDPAAYARHHHSAPFFRAGKLAVEVHHALSRLPVTVPNSLTDLRSYVSESEVDGRAFRVLDACGTALHLAVHCLTRPALREIALLALHLKRMNAYEYDRFSAIAAREQRYAIPLHAALTFAARIGKLTWPRSRSAERFAMWMLLREDLPRPLRARTACVDAWLAATEAPVANALAAAFENRSGGLLRAAARGALQILAAGASVPYAAVMRR
jgi:hypothetical protein